MSDFDDQRPKELPLVFVVADIEDTLASFPPSVKRPMGFALFQAQIGDKHPNAKPLKGGDFKGAGVLEVVEDYDGNTYRAVYTVRFARVLYVLDAFQKKSKKGIATPKQDIERIKSRLKRATKHYEENYEKLKVRAGKETRR